MTGNTLYEEYCNEYPLIMGYREVSYESWLQRQVLELRENVVNKNCNMNTYDKMSKENENLNGAENSALNIADVSTSTFRVTLPLEMIWQPKEDITTYELAMCVPYFFRHHGVMPYEVDKSLPHFRHFKIIDHNVL